MAKYKWFKKRLSKLGFKLYGRDESVPVSGWSDYQPTSTWDSSTTPADTVWPRRILGEWTGDSAPTEPRDWTRPPEVPDTTTILQNIETHVRNEMEQFIGARWTETTGEVMGHTIASSLANILPVNVGLENLEVRQNGSEINADFNLRLPDTIQNFTIQLDNIG